MKTKEKTQKKVMNLGTNRFYNSLKHNKEKNDKNLEWREKWSLGGPLGTSHP
jgi:hypothetical protein